MALLILGSSRCALCGHVIEVPQSVVCFAPFVPNELDPLFIFNDAAVHEECFEQHPLCADASARYQQMRDATGPKNRRCRVCEHIIDNPDDHMGLGHLIADPLHPLFAFNFAQLHRRCLVRWPDRKRVKHLLQDLRASGNWRGIALNQLIEELEERGMKRGGT